MHKLNWIEQILVITARQVGSRLSSAPRGNPNPVTSSACQRFLEAHGPEYADMRAWKAREARLALN